MKKQFFVAAVLLHSSLFCFSQNYINGAVSLNGDNTAAGATTVASGASFYFNKNKFYEKSNFINLGDAVAVSADSGTLVLDGTGLQTISGRFSISAVKVDNTAGAAIGNTVPATMVTLLDSLSFGNINHSDFNTGNGAFTLKSTAAKTARIADLTNGNINAGNTVSGNVIAERYIQSRRAWRVLCPPTTADSINGQTIKDAWQEGATAPRGQIINPNPGYGTVITRPGSNPVTATGYDDGVANTATYSLRTYNSNGLISFPANTDFTRFGSHAAYILFVRGDRSVSPATQTSSNQTPSTITILRSKGALHNGIVKDTVTNTAGSFAGVGNPYACAIDFSKIITSGITNGFYVWDPTIGTLGAWVYIDGDDNYNATPSGAGAYTNAATNAYIQSGEAILVKTTASNGFLTFGESCKNLDTRSGVFRETPFPSITINLFGGDDSSLFMDGAKVLFDDAYSKSADVNEDVFKPSNPTENLAFYAGSDYLMKEKWALPGAGDSLLVKLWNTSIKKYRMQFHAEEMAGLPQAYWIDKYSHTSMAISAGSDAAYDFEITNDTASRSVNRFAIVFNASALPVTISKITAGVVSNGIDVQWLIQNEADIKTYEVESAADGRNFIAIGSIAANGSGSYSYLDIQPATGDNFYRIKYIHADGSFTYSSIATATITGGKGTVQLVNNPVQNNAIQLRFNGLEEGSYRLTLYSGDGKAIVSKSIYLGGGSSAYLYTLPVRAKAKGIYVLQVKSNADNHPLKNIRVAIE